MPAGQLTSWSLDLFLKLLSLPQFSLVAFDGIFGSLEVVTDKLTTLFLCTKLSLASSASS